MWAKGSGEKAELAHLNDVRSQSRDCRYDIGVCTGDRARRDDGRQATRTGGSRRREKSGKGGRLREDKGLAPAGLFALGELVLRRPNADEPAY
jgi:hypothetical protein